MIERNAVRLQLQHAGNLASKGMLAAALTLSLSPTLALAQQNEGAAGSDATNTETAAPQTSEGTETSSSAIQYTLSGASAESLAAASSYDLAKIADGTYEGSCVIVDNGAADNDDVWAGYTTIVKVTVADHKITNVDVTRNEPSESAPYVKKAVDGTKNQATGVPSQIVAANGTGNVEVISGATYSSNAIVSAVDDALAKAAAQAQTDEYTYGFAALSWTEYWQGEGVYNADDDASSTIQDSHEEYDKGGYDVVTRATTNHGMHRGSYQSSTTVNTKEGKTFEISYWPAEGKGSTFVTTDGKTVTKATDKESGITTLACDGETYTFEDYDVTGIKYVPVKVKTSDLDAFKAQYSFVANGETLEGGYGEGELVSYSGLVADVDAATNNLKTATKSGDGFEFSENATGADSGIKDQALKTANLSEMGFTLKAGDEIGSYGEFIRVDFTENFGDLGANLQSVTWTYYGSDTTATTPLATYGTKFAADNWMHKKLGLQLGLTESYRCQLPEGTDGTGTWKVTIHALGYKDASITFTAAADNVKFEVSPVTDETKANLQAVYDKAAALVQSDYTADSWKEFVVERDETRELLAKASLGEAEAAEQVRHLQQAMDNLVEYVPSFPDVDPDDPNAWYAEAVQFIAKKGLMIGYENGEFGVGDSMLRAQLVTSLWRYSDPEAEAVYDMTNAKSDNGYNDVADNQYFTGAANWAYAEGVVTGWENADGSRSFLPDTELSFEMAVCMMVNMLADDEEVKAIDADAVLSRFTDADTVSSWAKQSVAWAVENGLVNGYGKGDEPRSIKANETVSRERGAAVLFNAYENGFFE